MNITYTHEVTLGTFTIGKETFTLRRVQYEHGSWDLLLDSDRKGGYRRPTFWAGDKIQAGFHVNDDTQEGLYCFRSNMGTELSRQGKPVHVAVCGPVFTLVNH